MARDLAVDVVGLAAQCEEAELAALVEPYARVPGKVTDQVRGGKPLTFAELLPFVGTPQPWWPG